MGEKSPNILKLVVFIISFWLSVRSTSPSPLISKPGMALTTILSSPSTLVCSEPPLVSFLKTKKQFVPEVSLTFHLGIGGISRGVCGNLGEVTVLFVFEDHVHLFVGLYFVFHESCRPRNLHLAIHEA